MSCRAIFIVLAIPSAVTQMPTEMQPRYHPVYTTDRNAAYQKPSADYGADVQAACGGIAAEDLLHPQSQEPNARVCQIKECQVTEAAPHWESIMQAMHGRMPT